MRTFFAFISLLCFGLSTLPAEAVTIRNKCSYPIAGSIYIDESNTNVAQFRIIPGEKVHLLKNYGKIKLRLQAIPDVYDMDKLSISYHELDTADCYIELKNTPDGIKITVD